MRNSTKNNILIGVKQPSEKSQGNIGDIWERGEDGRYYCSGKAFSLSFEEIWQDVMNGHLAVARTIKNNHKIQ